MVPLCEVDIELQRAIDMLATILTVSLLMLLYINNIICYLCTVEPTVCSLVRNASSLRPRAIDTCPEPN